MNIKASRFNMAVIARFVFTTLFMIAVLFISAGSLDWWEGWAAVARTIVVLVVSRVVLIIKNPEQALERMEAAQKENVQKWDKILVPVIAVYMPMVIWIVAGLDKRFGWSSDIPDGIQWAALVIQVILSIFSTWAMFENRFFSSHVRIQTDRGHKVVNTGPYGIMRHPGYTGAVGFWLASPLFFGSHWLWIPCVLTVVLYVVRTALEDRTLQEELPGYKEYTKEVKYRLLPGIW